LASVILDGNINLANYLLIPAKYIFGANTKNQNISMTAPVVENKITSESIAMTAPVIVTFEGEAHIISFGMPRSYTLETLPIPTDSRVKINTISEKKMAAIRFSGIRSNDLIESKKKELVETLKKENLEIVGEIKYAGYSAP
jgi:effector-binding domain-containing protein